jgi:REP element-mobilizing transposase RayT
VGTLTALRVRKADTHMPRTRYKIYEQERPHFLTCTVINWLPIFAAPPIVQILFDSWTFLQAEGRLTLYAYVVMVNHVHLVAVSSNLTKELAAFKSFTARSIIDYLKDKNARRVLDQLEQHKLKHKKDRTYQLWQEGSHPQLIQNEEMMRQKVAYIHDNPVKRGYVDDPAHWRYSSARNYAGQPGLIEVETAW